MLHIEFCQIGILGNIDTADFSVGNIENQQSRVIRHVDMFYRSSVNRQLKKQRAFGSVDIAQRRCAVGRERPHCRIACQIESRVKPLDHRQLEYCQIRLRRADNKRRRLGAGNIVGIKSLELCHVTDVERFKEIMAQIHNLHFGHFRPFYGSNVTSFHVDIVDFGCITVDLDQTLLRDCAGNRGSLYLRFVGIIVSLFKLGLGGSEAAVYVNISVFRRA